LLKIICDRRACISQHRLAVTASLGTLATPVIGVVATVLVLGERPSTADIVGFALIFTASACVVFAPLLRAKPR
jgi:drug/metabolite transporter (DMT)-like permease